MRKILLNAMLFMMIAAIIPGISLNGGVGDAIVASLIYSLLSVTIKPVLEFIAIPLNFISFGLVNFLIGVVILSLTATYSALDIQNFLSAIFAGGVLGFLQSFFEYNKKRNHKY